MLRLEGIQRRREGILRRKKTEFHLKRIQQITAPTSVIESPHHSNWLNSFLASTSFGSAAMQSAPIVESGERSTRCPPTYIDAAIESGSAPRRCARPGTVGRNAGSTTPDVLL